MCVVYCIENCYQKHFYKFIFLEVDTVWIQYFCLITIMHVYYVAQKHVESSCQCLIAQVDNTEGPVSVMRCRASSLWKFVTISQLHHLLDGHGKKSCCVCDITPVATFF